MLYLTHKGGGMQVKFKLHIELTDKDYLDYNLFQTLKSPYGAKTVLGLRILLTVIVLSL